MPLVPVVVVFNATVPVPALSNFAAVCVMLPPPVLPPAAVVTAIVPPEPTVMLSSCAAPVPLAPLLTLIATALVPTFVVWIVPAVV